ncbi:MAG: aminotransferase class IV [Dehalococcoidia bacterium]|nr:aminotransferase class IV [Dehalococcoidia bacterium]
MSIKILSRDDIFTEAPEWRRPGGSNYAAMYSSVFGGIVTDPALMVMPLDDHIINRGDGIFEYFDIVNGFVYNFEAHLARFERSAGLISLDLPFDMDTIRAITLETLAVSGAKDCGVRLFLSRGFGDFGCDPTTPKKSLFYVVVILKSFEIPPQTYTEGVTAITTHVPLKPGFYAQVKSTCYLLNALVDLEARRNNADYGIWYDHEGHLTESSTENVAIVSREGILKYPRFDHMLKGTTLLRAAELAKGLVAGGTLKGVSQTDITQQEVYDSSEMLILTSAFFVVPVVEYDGKAISAGRPGPVFHQLAGLIQKDKTENREVLTPIPYP